MYQFLKTLLILLSLAVTISCSDENETLDADYSTIIEFGTECGWCAGTTNISIKKGEIKYTRIIPCGDPKGTITKIQNFEHEKWEELIACFDYNYFTTLDYNVCNVCVDGCDEIIKISRNDNVHEIRYNPSENIEGLEILQEKLREYLGEY